MREEKKIGIIPKVLDLCKKHDAVLLYLTRFGSHLYGTSTPDSDFDYKGVFLPSLKSLVLGQNIKSIHHSTGPEHDRNCAGDEDIELFSLQYWLHHLVRKGETVGLDLLFSSTNKDCTIFANPRFRELANNHGRLLTSSDLLKCAYVKYTIGQAKKYGIKGSRLGVLKRVSEYLTYLQNVNGGAIGREIKLQAHIDSLVSQFGDNSHCFRREIGGHDSLVLCGKVHQGNVSLQEFCQRVSASYREYGHRAQLAEQNQGVDWKACSHALRAIHQMRQLLTEGVITFPLKEADEAMRMKKGAIPWPETEAMISRGLSELEAIAGDSKFVGKWDQTWVDQMILSHYGL